VEKDALGVMFGLTLWLLENEKGVKHCVINCWDENPQNVSFCPRCIVLWAKGRAEAHYGPLKGLRLKEENGKVSLVDTNS
jgi:hypothetical protein